ncbi:ADP-ribosylglycohydrolase family protein [Lignipirellula cremea]|uniref:ADP-ribosyl-[dinitrogen reductase] glycohydrolase n=1 Tax=Lignipirellula cremea TaxID=2528010 RepID=A0A518DVY4_9BACT|nr:ADP-ribosylglycohydrolase family protein [Lignipirellula cremea]QDU95998.1 ADP-ribosyl-[dinitrogen reductase] glycohydrolase [Lignipirellula cremea]
MTLSLPDRILGCLLGGALGDAIGAHYEGDPPPESYTMPTDLQVTDDTQLTLATCEAIVAVGEVEPASIAASFLQWFRSRRLNGLGSSTLKALIELDAGGHWALVGATGERSAGNGAAMRIAPLAFFLDPELDADRQTLRDVCRITHRNDEAYCGALAIVSTLHHVLSGGRLDEAVWPMLAGSLPDSRVRDRVLTFLPGAMTVAEYAVRFGASGYVVDSAPLAILAATQATSLEQAFEQLVRCGGDTDTNASLLGQLYGAANGEGGLPPAGVARIDAVEQVRQTAASLARVAAAE